MAEKIINIDLTDRSYYIEDYACETAGLYGRGLVLDLVRKNIPDEADRYSPENAIVLVPGLFAGNPAPSACRMFVATIEGRDKGIQVCNTTGNMPQKLGSLGIAGVVIKGRAADRGTVVHIDGSGVDFITESSLNGCRTREIVSELKSRYGRDIAIIGSGIAGDMQLSLSSFFCTYPDGTPEYHSPRSGFGDVFGSKNLRAVVAECDDYFARECRDPGRFRDLGRQLTRIITNDEICGGALPSYGSITLMKILKSRKSLSELSAVKKDSNTQAAKAAPDGASAGKINRTCAPMCIIGCLNRHSTNDGKKYSSPSQVETQAAIKHCFGIEDYELARAVQYNATEIGIVATEFVTASKAFAEANGIVHGENHLTEWLDEIEKGSLTGRVIASRTYGIDNLYSDRHLAALIDRKAVQDEAMFNVRMNNSYPGLKGLSEMELLYAQIFVLENLGFCIFTSFALLDKAETFEILAEMFEARTGVKMTGEKLVVQANNCLSSEKEFSEHRWKAAQKSNIPQFTKVLYRYFGDRKGNTD